MGLTCKNAVPSLSTNGVQAASKSEAAVFSALEKWEFMYEPHKKYVLSSLQSKFTDAYVAAFNVWIEYYGGTYPPNSQGSLDYRDNMRRKYNEFLKNPDAGRFILIMPSAKVHSRFFADRLKVAVLSQERIVIIAREDAF